MVVVVVVLSFLVAVIGLLLYLISEKPKVMKVGEIMFFVGLLAFLLTWAGPVVRVLHP